MHWFWRAVIAVAVSASYMGVSGGASTLATAHRAVANAMEEAFADLTGLPRAGPGSLIHFASTGIAWGVPGAIITLAAYALATRCFGQKLHDGELRCRKCRYILRGLTEPRCPECGERI